VSGPVDPLTFDFGIGFESSADRIKGERLDRRELVARGLPFGVPFLDDLLRSILPHDLVLLGAETGAGKTEMARIISSSNAKAGRNVYYFALEAEPKEIERRTKFAILCELVGERRSGRLGELNYPDWYREKCNDAIAGLDGEAEEILAEKYKTLHTYYRGSKFDHTDIKRLFLAIQSQADLIVLDHLHYVDIEDDNENRGFKTTIKMIRDVALGIGKPVILIAHLRKRDQRAKSIVPHVEDFHGSSDIIKVVTSAVMLAPARCMPSTEDGISNTFMHVPKDRMGGQTGLVALCQFDRRLKSYAPHYTLGRSAKGGDGFEQLGIGEVPRWAKHHKRLPESESPIGDVGEAPWG
jgi:replicative DNA helicase